MKKGFCILLSGALLLTGTVPAWAKEERLLQEPHVYRGVVGTTNFYKDDVLLSLDTEIYLKDGYVMLPLRTFFTIHQSGCANLLEWRRPAGRGTSGRKFYIFVCEGK